MNQKVAHFEVFWQHFCGAKHLRVTKSFYIIPYIYFYTLYFTLLLLSVYVSNLLTVFDLGRNSGFRGGRGGGGGERLPTSRVPPLYYFEISIFG